MRTRATDNGTADGWRGARLGAEARDRRRREATRIAAEVDLGEPGRPVVAFGFLAVALLVTFWEFAAYGTSPTSSELARAGGSGIGSIATGNWWKLLTANLLHGNLPHVALNTFVIVLVGRWLEHLVGHGLVAATIAWSMLLSSVGALVVDVPHVSIGASGVAFGLIGCAVATDPRARTATGVIARQLALVNVIATFLIPGISIGGHLGGLAAGLLVGWIGWSRARSTEHPAGLPRRLVAPAAIVLALPPAALLLAGPQVLPGDAADARASIVAPLLSRQLSGTKLSGGREIDEASCRPAGSGDPALLRCDVDDDVALVAFSARDDQWSLRFAE